MRRVRPDLAQAGEALLYQFGVGLGFLATVRADGGPRVHPVCPVLLGDGLYAFVVPSPKRRDLERDGRYSLHSFPADDNEDAFSVSGRASAVTDPSLRSELAQAYIRERPSLPSQESTLAESVAFEFDVETCMLTRTDRHGDPSPRHTIWHEPAAP